MALTSMEVPKPKVVETKSQPSLEGSWDKFPYGLRITLNKDALKALGLTAKDFSSGENGSLEATYVVTETSDRTSIENGDNQSVSLQITKLGVTNTPKKGKEVAKRGV